MQHDDADVVYRQFSDPDMCAFFSEPPCDYAEALEIIEHYRNPDGEDHLRYGMFDKETNAFVGTCGYHFWDPARKQVEIGYDIWKDYWKQGYMTEAMPVLIDICFKRLGVDCIYILTDPRNAASVAAVAKFGFTHAAPCRDTDDGTICLKLLRA
ncbi:GNAT family N-acetyltransferase [Paenibacillus rhizovicinus]|uniref:GNAT family N-acetyltransferase n=1 Tax=Paenibacillus rhizovicinus TaxID=2704463 RepID=A0A6C0NYX0_9BACL|nr:GNAT family N-acetyltransferase [Paenibacillus rhizovicinus]